MKSLHHFVSRCQPPKTRKQTRKHGKCMKTKEKKIFSTVGQRKQNRYFVSLLLKRDFDRQVWNDATSEVLTLWDGRTGTRRSRFTGFGGWGWGKVGVHPVLRSCVLLKPLTDGSGARPLRVAGHFHRNHPHSYRYVRTTGSKYLQDKCVPFRMWKCGGLCTVSLV